MSYNPEVASRCMHVSCDFYIGGRSLENIEVVVALYINFVWYQVPILLKSQHLMQTPNKGSSLPTELTAQGITRKCTSALTDNW